MKRTILLIISTLCFIASGVICLMGLGLFLAFLWTSTAMLFYKALSLMVFGVSIAFGGGWLEDWVYKKEEEDEFDKYLR